MSLAARRPPWKGSSRLAVDAVAAIYKQIHCGISFPMMRQLFNAVVKPTVSYDLGICSTLSFGTQLPELEEMNALQLAIFRQLCKLLRSESASLSLAGLAEVP